MKYLGKFWIYATRYLEIIDWEFEKSCQFMHSRKQYTS